MNFSELVTEFQVVTGRYDLTEARIKALIKAGQVYMDGRIKISNMLRKPYSLSSGSYSVQMTNMSRLEQVFWKDADGVYQGELIRKTWEEYTELYPDIANEGVGTLAYYSMLPNLHNATVKGYTLYVGPPTDQAVTIELLGLFNVQELSADADENIWSVLHPYVLIQAARMMLEGQMRNTEGFNDDLHVLETQLMAIDRQNAASEDPGYDALQG